MQEEGIHLRVNGEPHMHRGSATIVALLSELGASCDRVAVMLNDRVVPRSEWDRVMLKEGDRVEVLTFMGGG